MRTFLESVRDMKKSAFLLVKQSFPFVSIEEELDVSMLKTSYLTLDGYDIIVTYSINEHINYYAECVQLYGREIPFLPFYLVCKVAKIFLGENDLVHTSAFADERKVYCWRLRKSKLNGKTMPFNNGKDSHYEGLSYSLLDLKTFNLYSQE